MTHEEGFAGGRRMRVLHLVSSDQRRGAEVFASQLAGRLRSRGHGAAVCALYRAPDGAEGLGSGEGGYGPLGGRSVLEPLVRFSPAVVWGLRGVVREHRPDVIVAHGSSALRYGALCRLVWRRARTVYINIGTASFWANTAGRVRFNRLLLRGIDAVVSVSEHTRRDFMELYSYPGDRVAFIPNAVES
ncbi:MAG: glycosyltransferase family 4 protein, partial [Dehalococcoidia bacterium]